MTLREFFELLNSVGIPVYHYEAELEAYPYIVYNEFGTRYDIASNKAYTERSSVEVVHFSQIEFDPTFEQLKTILLKNSIFFTVATTFDKSTKAIINQLEVELLREVGDVIG